MAKIDENIKVMMLKGESGSNIESIDKTATDGIVDSYTITLTDGTKHTFDVTNGSSIASIKKTGTSGLEDTYTVTLTNGNTTTFTVKNGNGITSIEKTSTNALVDTYTINYSNGTHGTFSVTNGRGITKIEKTGSDGINDIYTITYNDGTTSTYNVVNADTKELTDKFDSIEGITSEKFVSGTACTAGNYYIANDTLYKCIANTDGTIPVTNTTYFTETTVMGEVGSIPNMSEWHQLYKGSRAYEEETTVSLSDSLDNYKLVAFVEVFNVSNSGMIYSSILPIDVFKVTGIGHPNNSDWVVLKYMNSTSIKIKSKYNNDVYLYGIK